MSQITHEVLYARYPHIIKCPLETSDGWGKLIDELCGGIESVCTQKGLTPGSPGYPETVQVKQKWGELRFYVGGVDESVADEVYQLIGDAETRSCSVCELCGEPGKIGGTSWLTTLCSECRNP